MKLLLDMNLPPSWVLFLRAEGFDAVHWSSVGAATAPDRELMAWAVSHRRILLTHDLDFGILLALTAARGPSVVQIRGEDVRPETMGRDIVRVLHLRAEVLEQGALVTIDEVKSCVRILPFATSGE